MKKKKTINGAAKHFLWCCPLILVSLIAFFSAKWYLTTYGQLGFAAVLFTMGNNLTGTQSGLIIDYCKDGLLPAVLWSLMITFVLCFHSAISINMTFFKKWKFRIYPFRRWFSSVLVAVMSVTLLYDAAEMVGLIEYVTGSMNVSTLYEDEYIFPEDTSISFPQEKRNLIYIYVESAENSFFSEEHGGGLKNETMPELYALAQENTNFSNNNGIGGGYAAWGSSWTVGAMVAQTAGIPLRSLNGDGGNDTVEDGGSFLPGVTSINDILHENGYYQTLMVGSDCNFGGRAQYFTQHGVDEIYDLYTAADDGIIPEGYYVWWGFEDKYLYEYAKQEITEIARGDQPFAFTMLTVDTHHIGGYVCDLCGNDFEQQYENVFACASKQLYEFICWIQQQDFYENTTIVISGDHPTMDAEFYSANVSPSNNRTIYNCFINSATEPINSKNRAFTTMDMFPTTLAAMGCSIEGDQLGLGVNLFSEKHTLLEEHGSAGLHEALAGKSPFYNYIFIKGYDLD